MIDMIKRPSYIQQLSNALRRSPVTALLGPRQCGKTTLARLLGQNRIATYFDLESRPDQTRLQNPELALSGLKGTVILDEIQSMPELFNVLRVLVDRPKNQTRFLILGSDEGDRTSNLTIHNHYVYLLCDFQHAPKHTPIIQDICFLLAMIIFRINSQ